MELAGSQTTQPYDIQMDQFQVIDSKGKPSMLQTPDNVTSFRTQSMPKSTAAKEEPSVIKQKENQPEVKRPEV